MVDECEMDSFYRTRMSLLAFELRSEPGWEAPEITIPLVMMRSLAFHHSPCWPNG